MMKILFLITASVLVGVPTDAADCTDFSSKCTQFANTQYCVSNGWVRKRCQRACGLCAKDECQWGSWNVGPCSKTCGSGTRVKKRSKSPMEKKEGAWKRCRKDDPSSGKDEEKENCNTNACPQCELTSEYPFNTGCGVGETCNPNSNPPNTCVKCTNTPYCAVYQDLYHGSAWSSPWAKADCRPDRMLGKYCPYNCGLCPGVCRYDNQCDGNKICREFGNRNKRLGICVEPPPCRPTPSSKKFGYLLGQGDSAFGIIDKLAKWCTATCKDDRQHKEIFVDDLYGFRTDKYGNDNGLFKDCWGYCDNCHCCHK